MYETEVLRFRFSPTFEVRAMTPEERLMVAVLEEALATYERGFHSSDPMVRQASREVDEWVRASDHEGIFSFESVCSTLGLDAGYQRAGLSAMKRSARTAATKDSIRKLRRTRITDRRGWRGHIG
jgi:hypothetical protein